MISGNKNIVSRLRHRLTLQQEIRSADGAGGYVRTWLNIADLWAEVDVLNGQHYGRERFYAGQVQAEVSHRITIRYRSGVSTSMRLLFENRVFNIRAIANIHENNEVLELLVEEGVAG